MMDGLLPELLGSCVGTIAFALLFGVPRKYFVSCGVIGTASWLVYRLTLPLSVDVSFAVFFGAAAAVLLSRVMAVRKQCPATVFMITGVFPLVPGAQIYWAAYYLVTGQFSDAMDSGIGAVKVMVAIVLGIIFVFEIPNRIFQRFRRAR